MAIARLDGSSAPQAGSRGGGGISRWADRPSRYVVPAPDVPAPVQQHSTAPKSPSIWDRIQSVNPTSIARLLPGGQNDLKEQQRGIDQGLKDQAFIRGLQKNKKINNAGASKLSQNSANNSSNGYKQASATSQQIINPKTKTFGQSASAAGQVFNSTIGTTLNSLIRLSPGGQNDIKEQQRGAQQTAKDTKFISGLKKSGKMSGASASKILANNGQGQSQSANDLIKATDYRNLGASPIQNERTAAKGIARMLPGGLNDVNNIRDQSSQALKDQAFIRSLQKSGKASKAQSAKLMQNSADNASGASGEISNTIKDMPTTKQFAIGLAGTGLDALTGGAATKALLKKGIVAAGKDKGVNELLAGARRNAALDAGRVANETPTKITVKDLSSGASTGKVKDLKASGKGVPVKDVSTPTKLTPTNVTAKGYTGEFKKISDGYDKQSTQIAKLPPAAQKVRQELLDTKAQKAIDELNVRSSKTQFKLSDLNTKSTTLAAKERPVVGKQISFKDVTSKSAGAKAEEAATTVNKTEAGKLSVSGDDATTKAPKAKMNEAGAVAPGKALQDVQDMIKRNKDSTTFSGDVAEGHARTEGAKKAISEDTTKLIKNHQNVSNADKQLLQDYRDKKAAGLTPAPLPRNLVDHDAAVTALNRETQKHDAELARLNGQQAKAAQIESRDPSTYTHREAQDKGTSIDYLKQGTTKSGVKTGGLSRTTNSQKARVYHAITDESGNRQVVAIKNSTVKVEGKTVAQGKLVTALSDGGETRNGLGKLDLKTDADRMAKETAPIQRKIDSLEREQKILSATKSRSGAASSRLTNINKTLDSLYKEHGSVVDKYNSEEMLGKTFIGKDGKKYTIGQATTDEITKASGQKYYVDPHTMSAKNYAESRNALENARYIESIKQHPDFEKFASPPGQTAPAGWREVNGLMQFQGYKFEPKTAEVLTDIVNTSSELDLGDKIGNIMKQTIVAVPIKHTINEGVTYAIDRGLSAYANPLAYKRGVQSLVEAFHEVTNMGPKFMASQKAGLHTVTGGDEALNKVFNERIKTLDVGDRQITNTAKQWGTSPIRLYKAIQQVTVWQAQDILNLARVIERTKPTMLSKGMSIEEAVAKTKRYNLQYNVPSRVGPKILPGSVQRGVSKLLKSKKVFFGSYRYDIWRIPTNMIKDTTNLKTLIKDPKQNIQALDKLAALAVVTGIVWPEVNKGIQKLTGNKNAYMGGPGSAQIPSEIKDVVDGKKSALATAGNQLYLSSPIDQAYQLRVNTDSFKKKNIYDPNASLATQTIQGGKWLLGQQAPVQDVKNIKSAGGGGASGVRNALLSLSGVRFPKNGADANKVMSLQNDSLPLVRSEVKQDYQSGNDGAAKAAQNQYNDALVNAYKKSLQSTNKPVPSDSDVIKALKKQRAYLSASDKTIKTWKSKK